MHAALITAGTDGDIHPFVAAGLCLREKGHAVTLVANEQYQDLALSSGFAFRAFVSHNDTVELMGNPGIWKPIQSALIGVRWARRLLPGHYALLEELARDPQIALISSPPMFAAKLVQEKTGCPLANLVTMPWMILSRDAPPKMAGALNLPSWAPRGAVNAQWGLLEFFSDVLLCPWLNRFRRSVGLPPVRHVVQWSYSRQLVVGMFPEWYAPPQPDWPPQMKLAGFSMYDRGADLPLAKDLAEFCSSGRPPLVFTFGSGMMHGARLFKKAVEACEILGTRGIILTKYTDQLPSRLPGFIAHCRYAPFSKLFPLCAAVVHHGGMGTCAQAMLAAVPQLILPLAWDQPDNGARITSLGVGTSLSPGSTASQIAEGIKALSNRLIKTRCREISLRFGGVPAPQRAAEWIEESVHSAH